MLVIENSKRSTFDNPSSSNRQEQKNTKNRMERLPRSISFLQKYRNVMRPLSINKNRMRDLQYAKYAELITSNVGNTSH